MVSSPATVRRSASAKCSRVTSRSGREWSRLPTSNPEADLSVAQSLWNRDDDLPQLRVALHIGFCCRQLVERKHLIHDRRNRAFRKTRKEVADESAHRLRTISS